MSPSHRLVMSHVASTLLGITIFAAPIVALGVVLPLTNGASRARIARVGSVAAAAVSMLIALALIAGMSEIDHTLAIAVTLILSTVPALPCLLLRGERPGEIPLVLSLLVSGALVAAFALIGIITTFGATVAESTNIGAGPAGFFVLLPATAYVALEVHVFRSILGMLREHEARQQARASAVAARRPIMASPSDAPIRVRFEGCREISSGSPYQMCHLLLDGDWVPELPAGDWVRVSAFSPDRRFVGLARWDIQATSPGFHLVTIDCKARSIDIAKRVTGFCQSLAWDGESFVPQVWQSASR